MDRAVPLAMAHRLQSIFAFVLAFALIFPFPLVVQAEELPSSSPSSEEISSPEQPVELDLGSESHEAPPSEEFEGFEGGEPEPQALAAGGGQATDNTIQTLEPQFYTEPDPITGSLVYEYNLTVPPGRNGTQPDLALQYASQSQDNMHAFGYGWNVNIPYIERDNDNGTEKLYSQNYFRSSIDGEIVPASTTNSTIYGAKVDSGDFNQYQYSSTTGWVMTDKKGTRYIFGTSTAGRIDNPNDSSKVYRWMLQEVRDANGNFVNYQYTKDLGQIYPYKITYTNSTSTSGRFEVEFLNEARPDVATSSSPGFSIVAAKRINEIQVKVDGSWVRKYALSYNTGDNGVRSMLAGVVESGKDDTGTVTTLPAATFQYESVNKGWTLSSITSPIYFDNNTVLTDVNGDSLVDIINSYQLVHVDTGAILETIYETYINTGGGWVASSTWRTPMYMYIATTGAHPPNSDRGVRFGDVNGDGLTDLIQSWDNDPNFTKTWLNTGSGWATSTSWVSPVQFTGTSWAYDFGARLVDINGDGLTDLVYNSGAYINNGSDWATSTTWTVPYSDLTQGKPVQFEDINGDGLVDLVYSQGGSLWSSAYNEVHINNGSGWTHDSQWIVPVDFIDYMARDQGTRMADANGDGLVDLIQSPAVYGTSTKVYLNTGHAWVGTTTWTVPTNFLTLGSDVYAWPVDVDGDGLIDIVRNQYATYNEVYINNTNKTDLLVRVTHPQGGDSTFGYRAAAEYRNGSAALNRLPFSMITVSTTTVSDGLGTIGTTTYSYQDGSYYVASSTDRRFGGFNKVVKTDPVGNILNTYFHQGNTTSSSTGEYIDSGLKIGRVYRTEIYDNSGNLYSKSISKWDKESLGVNRDFVKLAQRVDYAYDGNGDHKDKAVSYIYNGSTGNVIQKIDLGEVSGSDDGTFSDTGSDLASTTLTYAASTTAPGFVSSELTHNQSAAKVKESRYYYDDLSLGSLTKGNQTKKEDWIADSVYASTTKAYNAFGLVTQERDARNNLTTYTYDFSSLYPATTTNALSQSTGFVYDYSSGKVKETYDPNARLHKKIYDGLDRLLATLEPDPSTGSLATTSVVAYTDSATPGSTYTQETKYLNAATTTARYTYVDGLNRKLQERAQAEDANVYVVKDWTYNTRGLLAQETLPYFASGSARSSAASSSELYIDYTYDPLERITEVSNTLGDTTNVYDQWKVTTTDAEGNIKVASKDARGNLVQVDEHNDASTYTTLYEYNVLNNLTKITDEEGNVRNFTYDGLGRRLTAQDLHDTGDGTYGTWAYAYDAAGNLASSTDPKAQVVEYTYDALNRVLTENYTGAGGTEVTYAYDTCLDGVGKVCAATSTGAATAYQYSLLGLVKKETRTIDATAYVTEYEYDRQGNQTLITMPDSSQVQYVYNAAGLPESVAYGAASTTLAALITDFDYAPTGKVSYKEFANCTESFYTYDATKLYRLTRILTLAEDCGESFMGGMGDMSILGDVLEPFEIELLGSEVLGTTTEPIMEVETTQNTGEVAATSTDVGVDAAPAETETVPAEQIQAATSSESMVLDVAPATTPSSFSEKLPDNPLKSEELAAKYGRSDDIKSAYRLEGNALTQTKGDTRITVGSRDEAEFVPAVTLEKWGEARITLTPVLGALSAPEVTLDGSKIVYGDSKTQARFYELPVSKELPEGGFEVDTVLTERPVSNVVSFDLDADNLDFFYQPALNEEALIEKGLSCTATECVDGEGNVVTKRPENVVGSYAAYYKNGVSGDRTALGGKNYKTGKAFHIYRPKISDAAGNETWGQLNITKGILTVTVPEDFLEKASYPVVVDPTFGYGTAGATDQGINQIYRASLYTAPADMGTVSSVTFYIDNDSFSSRSVKGMIVASTSKTILTNGISSASTYASLTVDWATTTFATNPILSPNTKYFLGAICSGSACYSWYDSGPTNSGLVDSTNNYTTPTDPTDGSSNSRLNSIYVTYTAGSSGNNAPSAPTSLLAEGQTNPGVISDPTPELSAIYTDPDATSTAVYYQIQVSTSSSFTSAHWDSAKTILASSTPPGMRIADITYGGTTLASSTTYYWRIKFWDQLDAEGAWSTTTAIFVLASTTTSGNTAPTEPTSLLSEGLTNPTNISDPMPELSAIYTDPDATSTAMYYQIQVSTSSSFATAFWDSAKSALASSTPPGMRVADISYSGSALASSTMYYWRIKFWDQLDAEGAWSAATSTFSLAPTVSTTSIFYHVIQDINYVYDDVGNITLLTDNSETGTGKVVEYTYDDLYRLTVASTTAASSTPYRYEYEYDPLGSITSATLNGAATSYSYAETGYANPHAPTTVGGITHAYDNNGNLTSAGSTLYTWDYRNRMEATGSGGATTTYAYDHTEQRVKKVSGSTTTIYPNKFYDTDGITVNKSIFAAGELVASIEAGSAMSSSTADTGFKTAGTINTSTNWSNFTTVRLGSSDNSRASATHGSDPLGVISDFNFGVPSGATINGIEVRVEGKTTSISATLPVSLSWNSGTNYTSANNQTINTTESVVTFGGSSDTWGRSWSDSEFSNGTFRVKLDPSTVNWSMAIDHVQVKVYYATTGSVSGSTTITYIHPDHLGGTNVVSNTDGYVSQTLDYYPFGSERIATGDNSTDRHYIGERYDNESGLNYLNNRYLNSARGQFLSQDRVFLSVGNPYELQNLAGRSMRELLTDPQLFNSYSYARNNPIAYSDPTGNIAPVAAAGYLAIASLVARVTLFGKAATDTFESAYVNFYLPSKYPDVYSQEYKNNAPTQFVADAALSWGSNAIPNQSGGIIADSLLWTGEYIPYTEGSKINTSKSPSPFSPYSDMSSRSTTNGVSGTYSGASTNNSGGYGLNSSQTQSLNNVLNVASQSKGVNLQGVRNALNNFVSASASKKE